MEYRGDKKWNAKPSLLGFGCMRLPEVDGHIDEELAMQMFDEAIKAGVNYFDTAYMYHGGASEEFVGKALSRYPRDSYYLATKLPVWDMNCREQAFEIFENQTRKLKTDYFDFYLLHDMEDETVKKVEDYGLIEVIDTWKKEGKIKHAGFSFHGDYDLFEHMLGLYDWDFCQLQYNYMDTEEQAGDRGYELAKEKGIPVIVMEPNRGGSLARLPEPVSAILKEKDPNASDASWAMRWVATHDNVKIVLSGMTTMEQVQDNLKTFSPFVPLSDEEQALMVSVAKSLNDRVMNRCTGCGYCMPCPGGVRIPMHFRLWNEYHMYEDERHSKNWWKIRINESNHANNCLECGRCEDRCPQHVSIIEDLKKAAAEMDALCEK